MTGVSGRLFVFASALVLIGAAASPAFAQVRVRSTGDVSEFALNQYGLTRMWNVQVAVDVSRGGLGHMTGYVSPSRSTTYYHVVDGDETLATYTELELDAFGRIVGPEGAKKLAEQELARLKVESPETTAEVEKRVVPKVMLYCMSQTGLVHALDGETGATLWVKQFGSPDFPAEAPGVNDKYVAVVNGASVYVADSQTGYTVFESPIGASPGAGPAVSDTVVHVPRVDGFLESHYLDESKAGEKRMPYYFRAIGSNLIQPVVSGGTISWPTTRGYLYVGDADRNNVRFRLECRDSILAKPAFASGRKVIVGSADGNTYCLDERSGALAWRFTTGEAIVEEPLAVENDVFIVNQYGGLFCIALDTGIERWWTPTITKIVSASKTRVYGLGPLGRLYVIDRETGGLVGSLPMMHDGLTFLNGQTDRLYLATNRGRVIAIRETQLVYPELHDLDQVAAPPAVQQTPGPVQTPPSATDPFATPAGADPFGTAPPAGGAVDPFADPGAGGTAPSATPDPFADPFAAPPAGGSAPPAEDPFGFDDPFGN